MRKPLPALLVTSVVIALTGSVAFAQIVTAPARAASTTMMTAPVPVASSATGTSTVSRPAAASSSTRGSGNGASSGTGATATTASPGNPTVLTNSDGSTTSTMLNADGTRTIVTTAVDGTTTTTTLPVNLFNSGLVNGAAGGVTLDGERLLDERDRSLAIDRSAVSVDLVSLGTATADVRRSSVSLDRVIKSAERDRKKIGRNGQLLNTIAPRTNVDRSSEMPDDGPTPALSGLSNSLSRR